MVEKYLIIFNVVLLIFTDLYFIRAFKSYLFWEPIVQKTTSQLSMTFHFLACQKT